MTRSFPGAGQGTPEENMETLTQIMMKNQTEKKRKIGKGTKQSKTHQGKDKDVNHVPV